MDLKTVLVTGANRGLGFAVCQNLLKNGHRVIATARKIENGAIWITKLKSESADNQLSLIQLDVANQGDVSRCYEKVREQYRYIDCLINNAGILYDHNISETTSQEIQEVFETNVLGPFYALQTIHRSILRIFNTKIINVSSQMGSLENSGSGFLAYRLSKTALNSLTKVFYHELCDDNIKVYSVCPGWVHTDMVAPKLLAHQSKAPKVFSFHSIMRLIQDHIYRTVRR